MTEPIYRRGDVLLANVPLVTDPAQSKQRPVVIVQNDVGNRFSDNLIVANISSQLPRRAYPTNLLLRRGSAGAAGSGLDYDSVLQAENVLTIPKDAVIHPMGRLNPATMRAVDECLRVSLGLS